MAIGLAKLTLLAFPQSWDGGSLAVRFLCIPKGDVQVAPAPGMPSFATANLSFSARLIGSLDKLPLTAGSLEVPGLVLAHPPAQKAAVFGELASHFQIVAPGAPKPKPAFRKSLTASYQALIGNRQHSPYLIDSAEYECALHEGATGPAPPPAPVATTGDLGTADRVRAAGSRRSRPPWACCTRRTSRCPRTTRTCSRKAAGCSSTSTRAATTPARLASSPKYAARIPPLGPPRSLFSALLFPVADAGVTPVADDAYREAELYGNGHAKLVHASQSDEGDCHSARLGRRADRGVVQPSGRPRRRRRRQSSERRAARRRRVPRGRAAAGRRGVELARARREPRRARARSARARTVRRRVDGRSHSRRRSRRSGRESSGCLRISARGAAARSHSRTRTIKRLHRHPALQTPEAAPHLLNRDQLFRPVGDKDVPLEYGRTYEFRVRFADLTRGGPPSTDALARPARALGHHRVVQAPQGAWKNSGAPAAGRPPTAG